MFGFWCVRVLVVFPLQQRLNSSSWQSVEHVGYYLTAALHVADSIRYSLIQSMGANEQSLMEALEVCVCFC